MKKDYLERQSYPTDLTDSQWAIIAPLFVGMREYKYSKRELLNAVLVVSDSSPKCDTFIICRALNARTTNRL